MDSKIQIQRRLDLIAFYRSKIEEHNRPYNIAIDICEKQIANLIKKGIDNFLLFDINFLNQPTKEEEEAVDNAPDQREDSTDDYGYEEEFEDEDILE